MASIQLCLLFILAICCISLVDTRGLGGDVNCSSLAANNPVIRIKPGFSVAAVAKCKGGNRKFTDYGTEGYSLTGYFTGSKPGCKWQRKKAFRNKVVYELVVHLNTRRVGGKRHAMKKTFTCTFPYRGGSMSTSSPPKPDKGNPFMPPKGMMAMFGKLPNADLVHFKVDTTSQTKQKYSYQARFRLRKKHKKWCGPAPYVTNASRSSTRAKSYKRIVYRCRPGFVPYRGITMIKCKSNRRYSKPTPRCVKVAPLSSKRSSRRSCGRTPSVRNSISGSGKPIKANQSVRYMCKKGYRLFMGISSIKCRPNGRFTRKPICDKATPRSCGRSPRVANSVSGSRRLSRFNRVVKYKCRRGYRFYKNKSTIKCLSNGKFTTPPRCVRAKGSRSCGRSPRVRNSVSGSRRRTRTNQVVRYRCRRGYKFLRGRSSIKCLKNGKFTPKPKCVKVKTCGKTPKVRNSVSSRVQSKVNKVYRYKCKPGYKFLMGRSTIKCRSSGKFTRKPRCVKGRSRSCGRSPRVANSVSGSRRLSRFNRVVKYKCRRGYRFYKNKSTIKCLSNGKFTTPPRCVRAKGSRSCGRSPRVRNSVSGSRRRTRTNQVVRYRCRRGYKFLRGRSSIKCLKNGKFTPKPKCVKVRTCGKTPVVANSLSSRSRKSKVNRVYRYKCKPGYKFYMGRSSIKCRSNGKFTPKPICDKVYPRSCGWTPTVYKSASGGRKLSKYNQVIKYTCKKGYKLYKNRSTIKCLSNGKFTARPQCVRDAKTCGKTPKVRNSLSARVQSKVNKVYRYKCKPGYKFYMGISSIKCQSNGRFTRRPFCDKVSPRSCGRSPRVANSVSGSRRLSRFNRVVKYKCRRGYRFYKNKSTIKCLSNGKFTTPPRCVRAKGSRSCGRSPRVRNSVSGSRRRTRTNQVVRYRCRRGYKFLRGRSSIKCKNNGKFTPKPKCVKVKTCGKTPKVRNSVSARVQSKVNKVYRYKCKPGYKFLMGRSTIKCRSSGKFTRKPRCVKGRSRSCGRSPRVANSVSGSRRLSRFNRVVKYKCRRGYRFYKNKSTIKCLSNGKFTTPPKCVRVTSCGMSPAVSNSIFGSGKKSRIYQVIRYKCKRGFRFLWEISAIWCRPDGRFSFKPRCIEVDGNRGSD